MDHHNHNNHNTSTSRAEAERLLGIAEKLLRSKDLAASKDFAILAQETEPLLEGSDQILAIVEVLLAAEKRVSTTAAVGNSNNSTQLDWYAILQLGPKTEDVELIKRQYRRLALLLHPDKNKFPFSDAAFHLVADSWAVLSDPVKKSVYDTELTLYSKVDLGGTRRNREVPVQRQPGTKTRQTNSTNKSSEKLPVRRSTGGPSGGGAGRRANPSEGSGGGGGAGAVGGVVGGGDGGYNGVRSGNFWTACPYCYNLYEYSREYEGCCLKCQNCKRGFTAVGVVSLPPTVPGKEAYYCCWGVFPMGFTADAKNGGGGFANWVPPMSAAAGVVDGGAPEANVNVNANSNVNTNANVNANASVAANVSFTRPAAVSSGTGKKRGRPRKIV